MCRSGPNKVVFPIEEISVLCKHTFRYSDNCTIVKVTVVMTMTKTIKDDKRRGKETKENPRQRASTNFLELGFAVVSTAGCGFFSTLPLTVSSSSASSSSSPPSLLPHGMGT